MKCRVTVDTPDGEGWVEALGLGRDGPVQKYMPYRTGATIKLTIAQTDTHVPEIVTDNPQARYLYYGVSKSGKPLNYTHIDEHGVVDAVLVKAAHGGKVLPVSVALKQLLYARLNAVGDVFEPFLVGLFFSHFMHTSFDSW